MHALFVSQQPERPQRQSSALPMMKEARMFILAPWAIWRTGQAEAAT